MIPGRDLTLPKRAADLSCRWQNETASCVLRVWGLGFQGFKGLGLPRFMTSWWPLQEGFLYQSDKAWKDCMGFYENSQIDVDKS